MFGRVSQGGATKVERLREDLKCPVCDYALTGLEGDQVICPECGKPCDITRMLTRQWTGPWQYVPGFSRLLAPVAWLLGAALGLLALWQTLLMNPLSPAILWSVASLAILIWILMLLRTRPVLKSGRGPLYALLAHVLLAGYAIGIAGLCRSGIALFRQGGMNLILAVLLIPMFGLLLYGCRRGERAIASACLRNYLAYGGPRWTALNESPPLRHTAPPSAAGVPNEH